MEKEWFESWFDSKYYHILYQLRDNQEASDFVRNLHRKLDLNPQSAILDLCCGRGRHSFMLHELGFNNIHGVDLSPSNISFAKSKIEPGMFFSEHDMRDVYKENFFDIVINLFTSFGYFEDAINIKVLQSVNASLRKNGLLVLDYLNPAFINSTLNKSEEIKVNDIVFNISRKIDDTHIVKEIEINDGSMNFKFTEKVKLINLDTFVSYFDQSGFSLEQVYGNYQLANFDEKSSPRTIMIARKIN